jgi:hypothetical protein
MGFGRCCVVLSNPIVIDESLLALQGTAAVRKGVLGSAM